MLKLDKILIMGLGVSGKSAAKVMSKMGIETYVYDDYINDISQVPDELIDWDLNFIFDLQEVLQMDLEWVMKSPGINPKNELIEKLKLKGTKIISDLELGFMFIGNEKLIGVTGTNGKTTTTVLINEILNACGISGDAVGNIGVGAVSELINTKKDFLVVECSSFQLQDVNIFKPNISVITNISSDHLDYHENVENYKKAKFNIIKNLNPNDFAVLNWDDKNLKNISGNFNKIYVSAEEKLSSGIYLDNYKIYVSKNNEIKEYLDVREVNIKGLHNYYNIMLSIGVSEILNLDKKIVKKTIENFQGVPHRLQFVRNLKGVHYYNDSKGTNSDSTIKAISAFSEPIIIILGGYDKKEDFTELLKIGKGKIKAILAIGETQSQIIKTANLLGYENTYKIDSLHDGVNLAKDLSSEGDIVLLSPACASWDMFKNFEERGNEFIQLVENLK